MLAEGLAEWEESERQIRAMSESYPSSSGHEWYFWCRRTGRGNVDDALEAAENYFAAETASPNREDWIARGVFRLLEGDIRGSLDAYRKAQSSGPTFTCSFMMSQLARQLGDEKMSEKVLLEMSLIAEQQRGTDEYDEAVYEAGAEILELLRSGDASEVRLRKIDEQLPKLISSTRSAFSYFVGAELDKLEKPKEAEKYWRQALVFPHYEIFYGTLAGSSLAERHETSRPDDDILGTDDLWPGQQGGPKQDMEREIGRKAAIEKDVERHRPREDEKNS